MPIEYKSDGDILGMRAAGLVVARIHEALRAAARPGATTAEMDEAVTTLVTPARDAVDEAVTTLMEAGAESTGAWSADESKTILLEGDDTPKEGDGR